MFKNIPLVTNPVRKIRFPDTIFNSKRKLFIGRYCFKNKKRSGWGAFFIKRNILNLFAFELFHLFLFCFALDAEGCNRSCHQSFL